MGIRFQRRIRVLPGVHLNLSMSGVGVSVGGRGAHIGVTARGRRYTSVSIPGTGLSYRQYARKSVSQENASLVAAPARCELCAPGHVHLPLFGVVLLILGAVATLAFVLLYGR